MRKSMMLAGTGILTVLGLADGWADSRALAAFTVEVRAVSTDVGTISADQKTVDVPSGQVANIEMAIYIHHTLDANVTQDPFRFGLALVGVTVNSQHDQINGVGYTPATPAAAVGNVTASLLHGGPNDPDTPTNGGSGFELSSRFNQTDSTFGDGTLASAEKQVDPADGDIDLVLMNIAQNVNVVPRGYVVFYGASRTVGVTVDTLIGTFTFTTNPFAAGTTASTDLGIYLPNTSGTFNSTQIRSLTGSGSTPTTNSIGPLFINPSNLGSPVHVEIGVPEPTSLGLLCVGVAALPRRRRR